MPTPCIHGFPTEQCASCRDCPHGLAVGRCARCRAAATSRKASTATSVAHAPEEYAGYEIFYEPKLNGWRFRRADASPSALSYRSPFLARRAVDQAIAGDADGAESKPGKASARTTKSARGRQTA
ncbi:MAG TPA: hypothetical protein VFM03_05660 [Candidatus Limnocylindria bacterium]|nr:hypothetical protein [Candidatus Limnocylindria bacterium]